MSNKNKAHSQRYHVITLPRKPTLTCSGDFKRARSLLDQSRLRPSVPYTGICVIIDMDVLLRGSEMGDCRTVGGKLVGRCGDLGGDGR